MKNLILIFCIIPALAFTQTEQLEKENLTKMFQAGEFDEYGFKTRATEWGNLLQDFGGYPELPYNPETETIQFINSFEFPSISKEVIFSRVLEWAAINFGSLNEVLHYKDLQSGKIILKGNFQIKFRRDYKNFWGKTKESITEKKCFQTYIFTVVDSKMKVEITDLKYEYKVYGYYINNQYRPTETYKMSIHEFYPITEFDTKDWKENLDLIYKTKLKIDLLESSLGVYILNYKEDYQF